MANPVDLRELNQVLDNLILAEIIPPVGEDDVTITKIAERYGVQHRRAKVIIQKLVGDGKLEPVGKRKAYSNGRIVEAWKLVRKEK